MPPIDRPVLISRGATRCCCCGKGKEVVLRGKKDVSLESEFLGAGTSWIVMDIVASRIPLRPYFGDQISSSMAWRPVIATILLEDAVARVSERIASDCSSKSDGESRKRKM